jgi:hypothetical protein
MKGYYRIIKYVIQLDDLNRLKNGSKNVLSGLQNENSGHFYASDLF